MRKRFALLIILAVLFITVIAGTYISFVYRFSDYTEKSIETRLHETVQPNIVSFDLQMKDQIKKVNTLAEYLGTGNVLGSKEQHSLLASAVKNNNLFSCAVAYPDGTFITHDNKTDGNVYGDEFLTANMRGEFFISDPRPSVVDSNTNVILFSAPIVKEGKVAGALVYSYPCNSMENIFNFEFLNNQGKIMVIKQDGTMLLGDNSLVKKQENFLNFLRENCSHKGHEANSCAVISQKSGNLSFEISKIKDTIFLQYSKLSYNDWYMVSMAPKSTALSSIAIVERRRQELILLVVTGILVYSLVIVFFLARKWKNFDSMTGILTIDAFKRKAKKTLLKREFEDYVCVKLDIKDFKLINRVYDFKVGDNVIKSIAEALEYVVESEGGVVAHIDTDTYVILIAYYGRDYLANQRESFVLKFRELMGPSFTTSVIFPTGQYILKKEDILKPDITEILEKVNFAHRAAKQHYDTIIDYDEDIEKEALLEKAIEDKMSSAITNGEFVLYLQPKFRVDDETLCGAEALVRWIVDGKMFMYPSDFIPVLERNGFVTKLDKFMFESSVKKIREFIDLGQEPIIISVNFSRLHLKNENFVSDLCSIADKYGVPKKYIEIELTESAIFDDIDIIVGIIEQLHKAGFLMTMDDFGSGYSCLAQLKELNVDVLKIDKGFFDGDSDHVRTRIVVESIINMTKKLGIQSVAEGIEEQSQVDVLRELGCDIIQGYYFAKPMLADKVTLDLEPAYKNNK